MKEVQEFTNALDVQDRLAMFVLPKKLSNSKVQPLQPWIGIDPFIMQIL